MRRDMFVHKWAASWQNQQDGCAPSEDSDQPGHPPSLIRVFAFRMKKAWVLNYPLSAQRRLWSDWATVFLVESDSFHCYAEIYHPVQFSQTCELPLHLWTNLPRMTFVRNIYRPNVDSVLTCKYERKRNCALFYGRNIKQRLITKSWACAQLFFLD